MVIGVTQYKIKHSRNVIKVNLFENHLIMRSFCTMNS